MHSSARSILTVVVDSGSSLPIGVLKVTLRKLRISSLAKRRGRPMPKRWLFASPSKRRRGRWAASPERRHIAVQTTHSCSLSPIRILVKRRPYSLGPLFGTAKKHKRFWRSSGTTRTTQKFDIWGLLLRNCETVHYMCLRCLQAPYVIMRDVCYTNSTSSWRTSFYIVTHSETVKT